VTCICSAALLSALFTGATCTIAYNHTSDSDGPEDTRPKPKTERKACIVTYGHSDKSKRKNGITLIGLLKEFSSITFPDVRTVAVDPRALTLAWSPVVEIVRLTASDPKFTTCAKASRDHMFVILQVQAKMDMINFTWLRWMW
jgi:hypothetical protein